MLRWTQDGESLRQPPSWLQLPQRKAAADIFAPAHHLSGEIRLELGDSGGKLRSLSNREVDDLPASPQSTQRK